MVSLWDIAPLIALGGGFGAALASASLAGGGAPRWFAAVSAGLAASLLCIALLRVISRPVLRDLESQPDAIVRTVYVGGLLWLAVSPVIAFYAAELTQQVLPK